MDDPTCPILIENAMCVATCDDAMTRLTDASILLRDGKIEAVGPRDTLPLPPDDTPLRRLDASRHVVVPGFVNTHHHLFQTLTRVLPAAQNAPLFDWLVTLYEVWRGITPEAVHAGALAGLGELLLTGCTLTTDHHYLFPRATDGELIDAEIRAARTLGIRFHPTRGSMSRGQSQGGLPPDDVCQTPDEILRDSERVVDAYHDPAPHAMTRVALAPCSPFSVTPDLMRETARLARDRGLRLHTHLAETREENEYCERVYGKRPVALMEDYGWIGPDVWFAHCVHLDAAEIDLFARTGCSVAHCPSSNMRLASGIAPVPRMVERGVNVGLAVDGSSSNDSSDMLGELHKALLLHRTLSGAEVTTADMILRLATRGGARTLGWEREVGRIAPGMAADLALFRLDTLPYIGASVHDPVAALLFCGASHIADFVVVAGRVVVEGGRLVFAAEDEIVERTNAVARDLVRKAKRP